MSDDAAPPFPEATGKTMVMLHEMHGGVVFDANLAVRIAEALCETHFGKDALERQKPLFAIDGGTYWRVEGNWNRDREVDGPGAFFVSIEKSDGRITDIGAWWVYHAHPSVIPLVEQHLREAKSDGTE
jgi:hypothetical protein